MMKALLFMLIISLSASATTSLLGCEVLLHTSFGRLVKVLAEKGLLTLEELDDLSKQEQPVDPYRNRDRDESTLAIKQAFAKALKRKETLAQWPQIREAAARLYEAQKKTEDLVEESQRVTERVIHPTLHATVVGAFKFAFNPKKNTFVGLIPHPTNVAYFVLNLKTKRLRETELGKKAGFVVRRNGTVWVATTWGDEIVVRQMPFKKIRTRLPYNDGNLLYLYESLDGRLFLANITRLNGLIVYDISDEKHPKEILNIEDSDPSERRHEPIFHTSRQGTVFMTAAAPRSTQVFRYNGERMNEVGTITHSREGHNRSCVMITDDNENVLVGEAIATWQGYRVWTFKDGKPEIYFERDYLQVNAFSAGIFRDAEGQIKLAVARADLRHGVHIINLSQRPQFPETFTPLTNIVAAPLSAFKIPNGLEVVAALVHNGRPVLISPDGAIVASFATAGGSQQKPVWTKSADGNVYVALETQAGVQVFDVLRRDHE